MPALARELFEVAECEYAVEAACVRDGDGLLPVERQHVVYEVADRRVRLDGDGRGHRVARGSKAPSAWDDCARRVEEEEADEREPESHEGVAHAEVEPAAEDDERAADELPAEARDARRLFEFAVALPEEGAQHAPAVERVAGQEVRRGDCEVPEADD